MGMQEIMRLFFCGPPYDSMLLIHNEWMDVNAKRDAQPVSASLRYSLDLRDVPSGLADVLGREAQVRTYVRTFQLESEGIQACRQEQQADGRFAVDFHFFPMRYNRAARIMQRVAQLDKESSSRALWDCAGSIVLEHSPPRYAE